MQMQFFVNPKVNINDNENNSVVAFKIKGFIWLGAFCNQEGIATSFVAPLNFNFKKITGKNWFARVYDDFDCLKEEWNKFTEEQQKRVLKASCESLNAYYDFERPFGKKAIDAEIYICYLIDLMLALHEKSKFPFIPNIERGLFPLEKESRENKVLFKLISENNFQYLTEDNYYPIIKQENEYIIFKEHIIKI